MKVIYKCSIIAFAVGFLFPSCTNWNGSINVQEEQKEEIEALGGVSYYALSYNELLEKQKEFEAVGEGTEIAVAFTRTTEEELNLEAEPQDCLTLLRTLKAEGGGAMAPKVPYSTATKKSYVPIVSYYIKVVKDDTGTITDISYGVKFYVEADTQIFDFSCIWPMEIMQDKTHLMLKAISYSRLPGGTIEEESQDVYLGFDISEPTFNLRIPVI